MSTDDLWAAVTTAAAEAGWVVRVVDVARLDAVGARVTGVLAASGFTRRRCHERWARKP